ncbi:cytochrome P450 [Capillimicrobium parvum]|uniref:Mycinamicin IV hydroxylase/epoxidase n=1 Tax=Capillimicrobium parvum TaxID=2884022 RepID=A0A9E7BZG1_9ACTN|nr:cytochrome P450 [Capillimicrobium parvum]UGS35281.1 Mycinamicin IV hydroxylase/epoxidase [Capillimicrobium parvum]
MASGHISDIGCRFDPLDPSQADGRYALWAEAREHEPVFYSPKYDLWFVTRYHDVEAVLKDVSGFSKCDDFAPARPWPEEVQRELDKGYSWHYFLSNNDPPEHTPLKRVVTKAMSRRQTAAMEPRVRTIARELIDGFAPDGIAELGEKLAWPFPALVALELLGFPGEDMELLKTWGDEWVLLFSDAPVETEAMVAAAAQFVAFQNYVLDHLRDRERSPREDLLSHLVRELHADPEINLALEDIVNLPIQVMTAGHVTGTLLLLEELTELLDGPDLMADVRADPGKIPALVEEALRFEPPVHGTFIRALDDVEVGGVTIPADARVLLSYGSANHDPACFADPDTFAIDRPDVDRHLGFGKGTHYCSGAQLARLEQRVALELLLERCPNLRRVEDRPPQRVRHMWLRGYESLWVQWDAPPASSPTGTPSPRRRT